MGRPCTNPWCDGEIDDNASPQTLQCSNCKAALYRWRNRAPGDAIRWHRKLKKWDSRLEMVLPDDVDSEVTPGDERKWERAYKKLLAELAESKRRSKRKAAAA